jgi:hypothetical protein
MRWLCQDRLIFPYAETCTYSHYNMQTSCPEMEFDNYSHTSHKNNPARASFETFTVVMFQVGVVWIATSCSAVVGI